MIKYIIIKNNEIWLINNWSCHLLPNWNRQNFDCSESKLKEEVVENIKKHWILEDNIKSIEQIWSPPIAKSFRFKIIIHKNTTVEDIVFYNKSNSKKVLKQQEFIEISKHI